jgi:hypothetical protein
MKEFSKYVKQWQDTSIKLNEAMQKDDFKTADKLIKESVDLYNKYKSASQLPEQNKDKSFGELNYMLETQLHTKDKEIIKECMDYVKNDPNLLYQFRFIDSLRNYSCNGNAKDYVNEALNMAKENIDKKTLKESVKKFSSFLALKEIGNETIKEEDVRFYKNCNKLISENKKMGNLSDYTNTLNEVAEYVEKHKKNPNLQDVDKLTEDLSQKIANLSEESQSLVKDIIDFKNPMVEENQKKVFNRFKNECLDQINVLKETITDQTELNGLESLKEDIEKRIYCKETIVKDLATLLEIRDILLEK